MKKVWLAGVLMVSGWVWAHDGGHGPKFEESAQQGGVLAGVIELKDAKLGPEAVLVYKAELVRLEDGTVKVYLYNLSMKPLDLKKFDKTAKAALVTMAKKKTRTSKFMLELQDGAFVGKAPKAATKPFNLDVVLIEGKRSLLAPFENLD